MSRSAHRLRGRPCFCGSGRAFKHCCLRSLRRERTFEDRGVRLRIWRAHGSGARRFAVPELLENVELGEFAWLASDTAGGASWMIDAVPVTLSDVLDRVAAPAAAEWVIEQTLALLRPQLARIVALADEHGLEPSSRVVEELADALEADAEAAGVAELMEEFNRFGCAACAFMERLSALFPEPAGEPGGHQPVDARAAA
jgi:hypothetical protein